MIRVLCLCVSLLASSAGAQTSHVIEYKDCSGTILEWANCLQGCEPGNTVTLLSDSSWTECRPDPRYYTWDYRFIRPLQGDEYVNVRRIDSMWTMRVDSIADTVPVWRMIIVGGHTVWPDSLTDFMPYTVIDSALVQVGDIRYRVDTSWVAE